MNASSGTDRPGDAGRGRVERVDERMGLSIARAGLSGRTLVTYARDHVTVRTPSKPDFRDGNTLDLVEVPEPGAVDAWIERFAGTIGTLGVAHVSIRWETPLAPDAPPDAPTPDPELATAVQALGLELSAVTMLLLEELPDSVPVPSDVAFRPVEAPSAVLGGPVDRAWHAATVLYRYFEGDTPDDWRDVDQSFTDWSVDVQRELASAERAQVWIATRHGGPVARLTVLHDRQGLAVVEDVVVHPVHRRLGIASALTHRAVAHHLETHPGSRVGIGADPGSPADHVYRGLGFRPHATVWTALRPPRT